MKAAHYIKNLPGKAGRRAKAALLLACAVATMAVPAASGGYSILKERPVEAEAAGTEGTDITLVAASAFADARQVMNASDPEAKDQFITNLELLLKPTSDNKAAKWQNLGLFIGPKDATSGTAWNTFLSPTTLSKSEVENYDSDVIRNAYTKYKLFGGSIARLNEKAMKKKSSNASVTDGLDSMGTAALKLGNFGTKFLNKYNPAPVLLSLYDSSNLGKYPNNELVNIVKNNTIMNSIVCLFGDKVGDTGLSFFVILNVVIATIGLALSLFLTLLGNQHIGDIIRKFLVRVVIGTTGIYFIGTLMTKMLEYVGDTILNQEAYEDTNFVENNLNFYDWYQTGFSLPSGTKLTINMLGAIQFDKPTIRAINSYTYTRLTGNDPDDTAIRERMETYTENSNKGKASFITPIYTTDTGEPDGDAWGTDAYYAIMDNFANNVELTSGSDSDSSPLSGHASADGSTTFSVNWCRYLWMSKMSLTMNVGGGVDHELKMLGAENDQLFNTYALNPIVALNILRTDFSGDTIAPTSSAYPQIAYVAYDAVNVRNTGGTNHMNSVLRFIAIFTIVMAALKGMITIFTAGFGGMLSGGVKTATGSSYGLGQAIGGVIAIFGGLIGISLILSVVMTLLDAFYGIAMELLTGQEILDSILTPIEDAVGDIPVIGGFIMDCCESIAGFLLTLIFSLTFPKLGGIPINTFCQVMADLPNKIAERAQGIEGMLMSGRSSAGGGLGPRPGGGGRGTYGRMASAQASQALNSAQRQAAGVVSGLAGAGGALLGAGLSKLGRSLSAKGDKVEGRAQNPGMDGWDEMSPEQQAAAAGAAADAGSDWESMDQDARQKAMEDRMAADEARASEASETSERHETEEYDSEHSQASAEGMDTQGTDGDMPSASEAYAAATAAQAAAEAADGTQSVNGAAADAASPDSSDAAADGTQSVNGAAADAASPDSSDAARATEDNSVSADADAGQAQAADGSREGDSDAYAAAPGTMPDTAAAPDAKDAERATEADSLHAANSSAAADGTDGADGTSAEGAADNTSLDGTENAAYGPDAQAADTQAENAESLSAQATEGNGEAGDSGLSGDAGDENVTINDSTQESLHAEQKVGNDIRANEETKNVDNSSLSEEGDAGLGRDTDTDGNTAAAPAAMAAEGAGSPNMSMSPEAKAGEAGSMAVHAQNSQTVKAASSQTTNVHAPHVDQSSATSMNRAASAKSGNASQPGQSGKAQGAGARRPTGDMNRQGVSGAARQGTSAQSASGSGSAQGRSGTGQPQRSQSAASIKDQRKARVLHAVGSGLQVAGGNRTLGDGLKDAAGHLKDAAVSYAVPEEYEGATFVNSVRDNRRRREDRLRKLKEQKGQQ